MIIAIEAQRIFRPNKHGMDFVALEVIRELQKIDHDNTYYIMVAPGSDRCLEQTPNFHIVELQAPTYLLWEQVALPMAVRKVRADLLHCTSNTAPRFCSTRLVVTLHDIIFLEPVKQQSPSMYQRLGRIYRRWNVPQILPRCQRVITVSEFERNHIIESIAMSPDKIVAIYNGYNPKFAPMPVDINLLAEYHIPERYIFFLGNTDPKKNIANTLRAYDLYLQSSTQALPLVIADLQENFLQTFLESEQLQHLRAHIILPGYLPNTLLPMIYNGSSMFLYPSLRESFGIPILEAMASGVPIITSNTSAMPEIAGEEALLIDPTNYRSIAEAMLQIEQDADYREQLVAYGLSRAAQFSWRSTAQKVLSLYKSIVR